MKVSAIIMFAFCWLSCSAGIPANSFVAATNDWYNGNFTNVYELAQSRLAANSNDVVGAYLMLEWDMSFSTLEAISNSITRAVRLSDTVTNSVFVIPYSAIRAACLSYRDTYLCRKTNDDLLNERYKAYKRKVPMINTYLLDLLDRVGLW